jgi:hypothetical protein
MRARYPFTMVRVSRPEASYLEKSCPETPWPETSCKAPCRFTHFAGRSRTVPSLSKGTLHAPAVRDRADNRFDVFALGVNRQRCVPVRFSRWPGACPSPP